MRVPKFVNLVSPVPLIGVSARGEPWLWPSVFSKNGFPYAVAHKPKASLSFLQESI